MKPQRLDMITPCKDEIWYWYSCSYNERLAKHRKLQKSSTANELNVILSYFIIVRFNYIGCRFCTSVFGYKNYLHLPTHLWNSISPEVENLVVTRMVASSRGKRKAHESPLQLHLHEFSELSLRLTSTDLLGFLVIQKKNENCFKIFFPT